VFSDVLTAVNSLAQRVAALPRLPTRVAGVPDRRGRGGPIEHGVLSEALDSRFSASQAQDQDLDCTKDAACLERIRAVASSDIMARASGPAPVASCINLKTHLGSTTSSRRTRRQLSVAARSWRSPTSWMASTSDLRLPLEQVSSSSPAS